MTNEIEVIDGVKGEWRTVTKPSEVTVGQRVRYQGDRYFFGSTNAQDEEDRVRVYKDGWSDLLFNGDWKFIQAFFPLPVRSKRKVAKVRLFNIGSYQHWFEIKFTNAFIAGNNCRSRKNAIRGARRFCKAIGYECEIAKEGK